LTESLTNFAINSAALAALSWVFARDLRSQARDRRVIEREEALARLQVCLLPVWARGAPAKQRVWSASMPTCQRWPLLCCLRNKSNNSGPQARALLYCSAGLAGRLFCQSAGASCGWSV